ncbi:beta-glucanase (GH16 family) [Arthrobacter sp. 754]
MGVLILSVVVGNDTEKMPVGDLPGWRQTGFQDFVLPAEYGKVGEVYGPDMRGYSGFPDTSTHGAYAPDSVLSVSDGILRYFLHEENGHRKVASVVPFGYSGQLYGRYSIRFRYDSLPGYKIAFMLWPTRDQWSEGEIDWPEGQLNGPLYGVSAIRGSSASGTVKFDPPHRIYSPTGPGDWHIATTEWTPGKVKWFWDGALVGQTAVPSGVPVSPMRWTLQAETADEASVAYPAQSISGQLEVDWVVQYAYAP